MQRPDGDPARAPDPVAVLSFSPIARDRRVLRQCALLAEMGHPPLAIGYGEVGDAIPYALEKQPPPRPTIWHRAKTIVQKAPAWLGPRAAMLGFWAEPHHRWALRRLRQASPRAVVANDWPALVVAAAYKAESGARVLYDSHEFATQQLEEQLRWRLLHKPAVVHLERAAIASADAVITVGPSLAAELRDLYGLRQVPTVVRNMPERSNPPEAEAAWPLRILYHGHLLPHRGLEALIASTRLWRQAHRLILRGNGPPAFVRTLHGLAADAKTEIRFEPAVPPDEVVPVAAKTADVGAFFTTLGTVQRRYTLPNKLFEYIAAGLAVAISPAQDMQSLVEAHDVGTVSDGEGPHAIAAAINGLTHDAVQRWRANARKAARILCWEEERNVLRGVLEPLLAAVEADRER